MRRHWLLICLVCYACGGKVSHIAAPPIQRHPAAQAQPTLPQRPKNTLYRDEIESAKRAGLGHFFERIELEPRGDTDQNGRMVSFSGFQIVALRPARDWLTFDFAPGDVLTHINGVSVEHYSTWYSQFEMLPKAEQIRVDLIREGQPKTVIVRILERNLGGAQPASSTPMRTPSTAAATRSGGAKNQ